MCPSFYINSELSSSVHNESLKSNSDIMLHKLITSAFLKPICLNIEFGIIISRANIYLFHILQDFRPLLYRILSDIFRLLEHDISNHFYLHNQIMLYMQILIRYIRLCILCVRLCYKMFFL